MFALENYKNNMTKVNRLTITKILIIIFNIYLTSIGLLSANSSINDNNSETNILQSKFLSNSDSSKIIVIDPGHGGKDNGTSFHKIKEKNITLDIAKSLKKEIEKLVPNSIVILTRETDVFVPLYERIRQANYIKADLFISIHCNSFHKDINVNGTEVYTLGLTDSEENLEVAMRENASVLLEGEYKNNYEWYNPNSIEAYIFLSAFQNLFMDKSVILANKMSKSLSKSTKLHDRGVKQSGFVLLKHATMPSLLVETGFLSNENDRQKLTSASGKQQIAKGITKSIIDYFNQEK